MIMCPYCQTMQEPQSTNLCNSPKCGQKLPPEYVKIARNGHITYLGTFGLPSHGKTALLSSLMQSAQAVTKIVPGSYVRPLGDETQKTLNEWSARYRRGEVKLPSTTPNARPQPLLVLNNKFATNGVDCLVAYDLAGEALKNAGSQSEHVRSLSKVNTIWCVVSLDDLIHENNEGYSLDGLFNIYLEAMTDLHISIKGKNILIVYTKADLLLGIRDGLVPLPSEVEDYLATDPYDQLRARRGAELPSFDEDAYFARMCEISDILLEYTTDFIDGGGALVNMIRDEDAQVYFTINSAYGGALDAGNTTIGTAVRAIRVLDALIWAIKLNRVGGGYEQEVALIVPGTIQSAGLASQGTIMRFYDELSSRGGHVATYYPGQVRPAFSLGTSPTPVQSSANLALICPLLDHLKPGTAVVLLVNDTLPLDFIDLYATQWAERLLLVVAHRELVATWLPHRQVYNNDNEIPQMVNTFLEQLAISRTGRP